MNFKNKVCIITGGANGIGKHTVEAFLKAGAKVAFIDIDEEAGKQLALGYPQESLLFIVGDIAEESALNDFVKKVVVKFEKVDYLINNACIGKGGIKSGCSFEEFNYVLKLGITAPYMLSKLLLDNFNSGASIINISSTRSKMSQENTESYSAAKGGISALTHALSISLAHKVRVNSISPGWIETGEIKHSEEDNAQHPVGRVGNPMDIVKMIMFLCSEEASFITGQDMVVDGGMSKLMIYHNDLGWSFNNK